MDVKRKKRLTELHITSIALIEKMQNTEYPNIHDNRIISILKKLDVISQKYHKMSLLFYELKQSLAHEASSGKKYKEIAEIVKDFDFDKIKNETVITTLQNMKKDKGKK